MSRTGITAVPGTDVCTFLFAALVVVRIRRGAVPQRARKIGKLHVRKEIIEGIDCIFRQQFIRNLLLLTTMLTFFTGGLQPLVVPMILSIADAATYGTV